MEEFVGKIWHRFITHRANTHHPDAIVYLDEIRHTVGIFFRALGGEGGLHIKNSTESENFSRRSLLQRIAGTAKKTQYAWRDEDSLQLPDSIALFASRQLNRDLYLWLTALSVVTPKGKDWLSRNQYCTLKTLQLWPGLQSRYQNLLHAYLQQRPHLDTLSAREAAQENAIQLALREPTKYISLKYANRPPQPVLLWLHPCPSLHETNKSGKIHDPDLPESSEDKTNNKKPSEQTKRKKGNRTDMPDGTGGLLSFRLETLWSWAEYTKVDRSTVDDDDDNAMQTAEDMDNITLAKNSETSAGKIKLDLDLPAEQYDDIVLAEGIALDEWDYKQQLLQKDYCRLQIMASRHAKPSALPEKLRPQAHKIRRQFAALRPQKHWLNRQNEGSELDLENYIHFISERKQGHVNREMPVFRDIRNHHRDLSCLLLADLSLSTDAHVNNHLRVIDVIRDSLYLFSEALSATGDRFALHGFSSRHRNHVRFYNIKGFDDAYNDDIRGHIQAIRPGYYTRMGAAIRHATKQLTKETSSQKLLLILTDGKPNDLDKYEGRYGIEDTRMAILEAEKLGLKPFCITIDKQSEDYLPYIFGRRCYTVIHHAEELPHKLPLLYLQLTS